MRDFAFVEASAPVLPRHRPSTLVVAATIHIMLFLAVSYVRSRPVRVVSEGSPTAGIAAYVSGPVGVMPATVAPAKPKPAQPKTALKSGRKDQQQTEATPQAVGSTGVVGAGQPGVAPVRLGAGGNVTLIKRVQPVYPPLMQSARMTGQVVLDAIINPDGTISDITVIRSTNETFARSAIEAVKQWRYTAIGFQGILTVTVNFTLT